MTFKEWIIELFKDERGSTSIKPVIALIGTIFLCASLVTNVASSNNVCPPDSLIDAIMIIVCVGMGADSLDKFSHKKPHVEESEPAEDPKQ